MYGLKKQGKRLLEHLQGKFAGLDKLISFFAHFIWSPNKIPDLLLKPLFTGDRSKKNNGFGVNISVKTALKPPSRHF